MLYSCGRQQSFKLAARHLLIGALEQQHIVAALQFRYEMRGNTSVFTQGIPQNIRHIVFTRNAQKRFKIAAEIIGPRAFKRGTDKKNIIFVKLFHLYPPFSAVKNGRGYLFDNFIILRNAEFSGEHTDGVHQIVVVPRSEPKRLQARQVDI